MIHNYGGHITFSFMQDLVFEYKQSRKGILKKNKVVITSSSLNFIR